MSIFAVSGDTSHLTAPAALSSPLAEQAGQVGAFGVPVSLHRHTKPSNMRPMPASPIARCTSSASSRAVPGGKPSIVSGRRGTKRLMAERSAFIQSAPALAFAVRRRELTR
jgi:hypothetical protein